MSDKYKILDITGLVLQEGNKILNKLNLLVRLHYGHPDHQMEVCSRLSLFLRISGENGNPVTNRLMEKATTQDKMRALVLSMDIQERTSVKLCFSLFLDLKENMRRRTVLTDLQASYLKAADSLSYMIHPGHMKKFHLYQTEHLIAIRLFSAIFERMENNRGQLDDPFLSEEMRAMIHGNLQDDYPKYESTR